MPFQILGIDVAYVHSSRAADLAKWFSETLGLDLSYEDGHWFEFDVAEGSRFAIDETGFPRSAVEAQPVILSFRVDDIDTAVRELASNGVSFYPSVEETIFDAGRSRVATFQDAEGNWQQLSQRIT